MGDTNGRVPFPALTPSQRLHLEINGYVIIENAISADQVEVLLETTCVIEKRYRETGELPVALCHHSSTRDDYFRIDNLPHVAPCYFDYLTNPYLLGMVQEIVGGTVRLEQSDAHIRRAVPSEEQRYGFHRGIYAGYSHTAHGLYHFSFVKTLTNLSDLGPDDGGTAVIAGTHKVPEVADEVIIAAAMADPRLIHQVEAPAGSTLLFYEALMHSSGIIKSDRERVLIIGGYMPTGFQPWESYEPNAEFAAAQSDEHRALLTGEAKHNGERRTRELGTPAESRNCG